MLAISSVYKEAKTILWSICIIVRQNFSHGDNVVCDGSWLWIFVVREGLRGIVCCCAEYNVNNN